MTFSLDNQRNSGEHHVLELSHHGRVDPRTTLDGLAIFPLDPPRLGQRQDRGDPDILPPFGRTTCTGQDRSTGPRRRYRRFRHVRLVGTDIGGDDQSVSKGRHPAVCPRGVLALPFSGGGSGTIVVTRRQDRHARAWVLGAGRRQTDLETSGQVLVVARAPYEPVPLVSIDISYVIIPPSLFLRVRACISVSHVSYIHRLSYPKPVCT